MVFQASGETVAGRSKGADFKDLKLIKDAEEKSLSSLKLTEKRAERLLADTEQKFSHHEKRSIADLSAKLDEQFKAEEQRAKDQATKVKADGQREAEARKQEIRVRMPQAVEHIVKAVIQG